MKNLSIQEKIGMVLIGLSILSIFLNVLKIEESISEYGSYAASIGAAFWYIGWSQRKKAEKENKIEN